MPRLGRALAVSMFVLGMLLVPIDGAGASAARPAEAAPQVPHFTDVTTAAGIHVSGLGNASAWFDYNADGRLDLLATNSSIPSERTWLYRNDGDGTFTDVSQQSGLANASIRSVAIGDYDNDGWPDIAATGYGFSERTQLWHNNGDGTFTEVGRFAGMKTGNPWRVSWVDYDRDGFLDLYQANTNADFLYHNDGDGTFTELARQAGVSNGAFSNDGAWADFDGDGWPDLFVADDGADHLYRNDGDGTFTDVTLQAGVSDSQDSQAACWGDYDADGHPDLYVVDIDATRNHLYRNDGDGTFTDVTQQAGVADVGDGRTCDWLDADQDGKLDLMATDHVHKSKLFLQGPGSKFHDAAVTAGIADPFDVFNAAWGDYDGDGGLDLFVVGHDGNVLYRNDGPTGGFLEVDLIGMASNRSAIGAVVTLDRPGSSPTRSVDGADGAYGQDSLTVEFGVGDAPGPFGFTIRWPCGSVLHVPRIARNSHIAVTEGPLCS